MTAEEIAQLNLFGCTSRCVIRNSVQACKPIKRDEFVEKYRGLFPEGQIGLLSLDGLCYVLKDLNLCEEIYSVRNPAVAMQEFQDGQTVHVLTDMGVADQHGNIPIHYHCRLAMAMTPDANDQNQIAKIVLYNPKKDGTNVEEPTPFALLEQMLVHFLILY